MFGGSKMETDIQREAISAWLKKDELEKAISIGLHGAPELRRDEKRRYLGEFSERVKSYCQKNRSWSRAFTLK